MFINNFTTKSEDLVINRSLVIGVRKSVDFIVNEFNSFTLRRLRGIADALPIAIVCINLL